MLPLNMHGAKYSLARAINLVSAGPNSKLYPYCLICFRTPRIPRHEKKKKKVSQPELKTAKPTEAVAGGKKKKKKVHFSWD